MKQGRKWARIGHVVVRKGEGGSGKMSGLASRSPMLLQQKRREHKEKSEHKFKKKKRVRQQHDEHECRGMKAHEESRDLYDETARRSR